MLDPGWHDGSWSGPSGPPPDPFGTDGLRRYDRPLFDLDGPKVKDGEREAGAAADAANSDSAADLAWAADSPLSRGLRVAGSIITAVLMIGVVTWLVSVWAGGGTGR